jgi:hypothetical protein
MEEGEDLVLFHDRNEVERGLKDCDYGFESTDACSSLSFEVLLPESTDAQLAKRRQIFERDLPLGRLAVQLSQSFCDVAIEIAPSDAE